MKALQLVRGLCIAATMGLLFASGVQVQVAQAATVENPTADGVYGMTGTLFKEGTDTASHAAGILDARVKLVKEGDELSVSVLVPKGATASYGAKADMVTDVAIRQGDTFVSGTRTKVAAGTEYTDLPVEDVSHVQQIAFGLNGTGCHDNSTRRDYSTYKIADLSFSDKTDWWAGYDAQAPVNLDDGVYRMSIQTRQAGMDDSTGLPSLATPLMGGNTFGDTVWITVEDGAYMATVSTQKVSGVYLDNFRYCTRAGGNVAAATDEQNLAKARTLTRHRNDDGSMYTDAEHGTYSDTISFKLHGKGQDPYAFMRMNVYASAMPFPAIVNDGVWGILMDWSTLEQVSLPATEKLESAVAQAEKLSDSDAVANANSADTWKAFGNRLGAAKDALKTSFTLDQSQVDAALAHLKSAQSALTVPYRTAKELGLLKAQVLKVSKRAVAVTLGSKAATFAIGATSNAAAAKFTYATSNTKVLSVSGAGKVVAKAPGTAKVTVTATANGYEHASQTVTVKVSLAKAKLTGKTKSPKKGKVTVAWKKVAGAQGYQLKVGKKTYTVKGAKALKKTVKAKKGKKVKVKVRAWSKASGSKQCGAWSSAKTVKVKKK